jgi:hypothetical protein
MAEATTRSSKYVASTGERQVLGQDQRGVQVALGDELQEQVCRHLRKSDEIYLFDARGRKAGCPPGFEYAGFPGGDFGTESETQPKVIHVGGKQK